MTSRASEPRAQEILKGYADAATAGFIAAYDGLSPPSIYAHVLDLFPLAPARIADIGAGTGRDAAWLAGKGHRALAVEPVRALREAGQALHPASGITWLDDHLPHLDAVPAPGTFDCVVLCAVWHHLDNGDRAIALPRLARLLAAGGRLVLSLRHGPAAVGRPAFPCSPEATIALASAAGLSLLRRREAASVQAANRAAGTTWTWLVLEGST